MKNMFNKDNLSAMKARVEKLSHESTAKWGAFTVHGMICHLQDALKYALGQMEPVTEVVKGPPMFLRKILGLYIPIPKGKIQTTPLMLSTKPKEWNKDVELLLQLLDQFNESAEKAEWPMHPFFGNFNGKEWACLSYRHADHHLSQFGV